MIIDITNHIGPRTRLGRELWQLYAGAFAPLSELAANRHVMTLDEFAELCTDARIDKYLAYEGGELVGFGALTRWLDAVPLVSPPYYRRLWPDLFACGHIWYVVFICTDHTATAFAELLDHMSTPARRVGGIVGMDFCTYNVVERHLPRASRLILHRLGAPPRVQRVDAQEFYVFEFYQEEGTDHDQRQRPGDQQPAGPAPDTAGGLVRAERGDRAAGRQATDVRLSRGARLRAREHGRTASRRGDIRWPRRSGRRLG